MDENNNVYPIRNSPEGRWLDTQRRHYKKGNSFYKNGLSLSQEKIYKLEKLPGWKWDIHDENWHNNYSITKKLYEEGIKISVKYKTEDGISIGGWIDKQRQDYKKNKLSEKKIDLLKKIPGWIWNFDDIKSEKWIEIKDHLVKSIEKKIDFDDYFDKYGVKLKWWITKQRQDYKEGKLSQDKIKLLENIKGWCWNPIEEGWTVKAESCKKEMKKNGNKYLSQKYIDENGYNLGSWVSSQMQQKKKGKLSEDKINLLESIPGWIWEFPSWDDKWIKCYELLEIYYENNNKYPTIGKLHSWIYIQRKCYNKNKLSKEKIELLEKLPEWKWNFDIERMNETWHNNYSITKKLYEEGIKISTKYKTEDGISIGTWIDNQRQNYKKKKLSNERIKLLEKIHGWKWSGNYGAKKPKPKKAMSKPEIKSKKTDKEIKEERQKRAKAAISVLHQKYKTMSSQNLNAYFKENPEKWKEYHKISQENEESFLEEEIPRNKMIKYLEDLPGKKKKVVADLGCGFGEINQYFKDNPRFEFHNFDHHSSSEFVVSRDIKNTELDDYSVDVAILSLAMWGSNCKKDYLEEAHRILDTGGTLLIAEPRERWKDLDEEGNHINRLVNLLEENNFTIIKIIENKFMFIECRKN